MEAKIKLICFRVLINDNKKQLFEAITWIKQNNFVIHDIVDNMFDDSYIIYMSDIKLNLEIEYIQLLMSESINMYALFEPESEAERINREWCNKNIGGVLNISK